MRTSREEWRKRVERWKDSGLTVKDRLKWTASGSAKRIALPLGGFHGVACCC